MRNINDLEYAWFKLRGMRTRHLQTILDALRQLEGLGWYDPLEAYAPDVTMGEWWQLVLSEQEDRVLYEEYHEVVIPTSQKPQSTHSGKRGTERVFCTGTILTIVPCNTLDGRKR